MQQESLKNKTQKGLTWSMIERFATQGVANPLRHHFGSLVVTRRLWNYSDAIGVFGHSSMFYR